MREFIRTCDAHYLAGCMVSGRSKVAAYERGYVVRVAQAVIDFFAEGADARA